MIKRNPYIANLKAGYLFPEIAKRRREFAAAHPEAKIISLGVGNTTEPVLPHTNKGLVDGAKKLGTVKGYSGYQDEGMAQLREKISSVFYKGKFSIDEIFISDGAKCDIGRLQTLFGAGTKIAVQDPSYPVYVDGSVLVGAAGGWEGTGYAGITYLPCTTENDFFPDLDLIPQNSLVYLVNGFGKRRVADKLRVSGVKDDKAALVDGRFYQRGKLGTGRNRAGGVVR